MEELQVAAAQAPVHRRPERRDLPTLEGDTLRGDDAVERSCEVLQRRARLGRQAQRILRLRDTKCGELDGADARTAAIPATQSDCWHIPGTRYFIFEFL